MAIIVEQAKPAKRPGIFGHLYVQVLIAIALGIAAGVAFPQHASDWFKPVGDAFIALGGSSFALEAQDDTRLMIADIVLADARMPVLDGLALVRESAVHHPGLPVLALRTFDAELVRSLLEAGAAGFLLRMSQPTACSTRSGRSWMAAWSSTRVSLASRSTVRAVPLPRSPPT